MAGVGLRSAFLTEPMRYLYYRYRIGSRQVDPRRFIASRRGFLALHQNPAWSGALFTPRVDRSGRSG